MTKALQQLLGDLSVSTFIDDFYLKQPYASRGGGASLVPLGSWETVESIWKCADVDAMLARQGRLWEGQGRPDFETARRLHAEGYTLALRHAERNHAGLAELARSFEEDFRSPVNLHVYCTPQEQYGFGWHYDAEDVFIIQTQGSKEYSLRKNTVNPWPLVDMLPHDMRFEREIMPVMKCRLEPGDWLYIPFGYWHVGQSQEAAVSLAVGLLSPAAIDVFDALRGRLLQSLQWRQRLPVAGRAATGKEEEVARQYQALFQTLADDLSRRLCDPSFAAEFSRRAASGRREPAGDDHPEQTKPSKLS
jgi:ribosomal protein L16 Arg81 hydroxylase